MNDAVMKYRAILDSLCELSFCPIKIEYKTKTTMYLTYFIIKGLKKGECGYQKCVYSKDDVVCSHQVFARVVSSFICAVGLSGACLSK